MVAVDDAQQLLGRLCADLRLLRVQAGGPSLRGLAVRLGLSKSQLGVILNGRIRELPDWTVVKGLVDGCRQYAQEHGRVGQLSLATGVEEYWRPRYSLVEYALQDASRRKLPSGEAKAAQDTGTGGVRTAIASSTPAGTASRGPASRPVPRELPGAVRQFVGRAGHLAALTGLLDHTAARGTVVISAIAGTAGVGKTALAVHWAHQVADRFPDGQLYVNLHGFDAAGQAVEPPDVIRRFLDALGVPVDKVSSDLDAQAALYRSELAGKRVLIVLDNARDSAQVRPLLPGTPGCLAVVTSRNPLTSLIVSDDAYPIRLDLLAPEEAKDLLARRIGAKRVAAEPSAVEDIVARCSALPLALAIVAAHAATYPLLPLRKLAEQLRDGRDRLDLLNAGDPATDLRAVFSWSYRTLTPGAARLFRLLGLHPGPDTAAPAVASLTALSLPEVYALLRELTRAGLLTEHTPGRYGFHDLLRAYATDLAHRVDPAEQRQAAVRRVLDHYLHTAHTAAGLLYPARDQIVLTPPEIGTSPEPLDQGQALDWLGAEQWAILAAADQSAATGEDGHTWRLAWTLSGFLERGRRWSEQTTLQRTALAAARRLNDPWAESLALRLLARADIETGRHDAAHAHLTRALDLDIRTDDQAGQAHDHHHLAYLRDALGDYAGALDHTHQALELYRAAGHRPGQAAALNAVGWYHAHLGDGREALVYCRQGLALLQELEDHLGQAATWDSIGYAHHLLDEYAQAIACFDQAVTLCRDHGEYFTEARVLVHLGHSHERAGDLHAARVAWHRALAILTELDHPDRHTLSTRVGIAGA